MDLSRGLGDVYKRQTFTCAKWWAKKTWWKALPLKPWLTQALAARCKQTR
jgi:hypothetical protein